MEIDQPKWVPGHLHIERYVMGQLCLGSVDVVSSSFTARGLNQFGSSTPLYNGKLPFETRAAAKAAVEEHITTMIRPTHI